MTGWIILFSVLAFLAIILFSSLKITLYVGEKTFFKVNFLFINLYTYDSEKKKRRVKKVVKKKAKKKDKKSFVDSLKEYAASKHKFELMVEIFGYLKIVLSKFKNLLSHTRFKRAILNLTVATDDAASTALLYGRLCAAVYPVVTLLDTSMKFDPKDISVRSDFVSARMEFFLSGIIKVRLVYILGFLISSALSIIKLKMGDISNGKQS